MRRTTCCPVRAGGLGVAREAATARNGAARAGEGEASECGYTAGVGRAVGEERTTCWSAEASGGAKEPWTSTCEQDLRTRSACLYDMWAHG